jgi:DNA modification methylase
MSSSPGRGFDSATERWSGVGPYYAMFPVRFANEIVQRYTKQGDTVLDPFAGRGTSLFSAAAHGRTGIGVEINPVGWVYSRAKLNTACESAVIETIDELARHAFRFRRSAANLPPFFHRCFTPKVQEFLLSARHRLDWKGSIVDCTTMAILLVYLHGKRPASLSNQMRQTKALSPDYAIRWWQDRGLEPPQVDPVDFMVQRVRWRYAKGQPPTSSSRVYFGDCIEQLPRIERWLRSSDVPPAKLLFTSPPYFGLTHYHYDQWLRLWLLGGPPNAHKLGGKYKGRFENRNEYCELLLSAFSQSRRILDCGSVIYVRTAKQKFTYDTTLEVLRHAFPEKRLMLKSQPFRKPTQTQLFGDRTPKEGEIDVILYDEAR